MTSVPEPQTTTVSRFFDGMRVMRLTDSARWAILAGTEVPRPSPGPAELLIRVGAVGVTTTELGWYSTLKTKTGEKRVGAVPGHEFCGVIADVGAGVSSFEIGEEVYGMNDWFSEGATAEYCVAPASSVAPKPSSLTYVEAASVPIAALTAWQGLFDRARLKAGERVLVHGGAGSVGAFAIQLARLRGAHVVATVSARNLEFAAGLGAEEVIDYRTTSFEKVVGDVDVVFDTVGGETLERSWSVLKPGGRIVTIVPASKHLANQRSKDAFFIVEPNQPQLIEVAALLNSGRLETFVDRVVPLCQASCVYAGRIARRGRGKIVAEVMPQERLQQERLQHERLQQERNRRTTHVY